MKSLKEFLLLTAAVIICAINASAQDAYATQNNQDVGGVNVTHSKEWYSQFEYYWPINTTTNHNKITDKATDPDQIIALLRYIYMNKEIPGIYYAGYGTNNNNLTTRARQVYYGGIAGGWDIPGTSDIYTDYQTYKPNSEGYTVLLVAVRDNFTQSSISVQGFYDMKYENLRSMIEAGIEYVQLLTDGMRLNENLHDKPGYYPGTLFTLENAAGLNRFFFLSKGQARDQYHADRGDADINGPFGRMFEQFSPTDGSQGSEITNYYEALKTGKAYPIQHDCNSVLIAEHYFSMVGKNATGSDTHQDVSGLQFYIPDQRLTYFESTKELYKIDNTTTHYLQGRDYNSGPWYNVATFSGGEINGHYEVTYDGRTMNYDEGVFYPSDAEGWIANGRCIALYKTGQELVELYQGLYENNPYQYYRYYRYTGNSEYAPFNYKTTNPSYSGNAHGGGYTEYAYYNLENFSPKTQWYRIEMTADAVQETNDDKWGEHTYRIDLSWHSSVDEISYHPMDQIYWVYEIINGEEVLISPEEGITNEHEWTVDDYENLYTEQYPNGRKRTFVVKGRPNIATYAPVRSNAADAIIPGYDKRERLSLTIGTDYYSKWNAQGEYNQYCNAVKLENGVGNSVTTGYIKNGTEFNAFRTYIDEVGDTLTDKFAIMTFTNDWQTTNNTNGYLKIGSIVYKMRIPFTVQYFKQEGTLPEGKAQITSGYLYAQSADQNDVFFGENGIELLDVFRASTKENTHPNGYIYVVTFNSSEAFAMDVLENGHLVYDYVGETGGNYVRIENEDGSYTYIKAAIDGEGQYNVRTEMVTAVRSNDELIPVFKSNYSLHNQGYTQEQVNNDNVNNMSNLMQPHFTYTEDGSGNITVATDLNKITVNLQTNATSEIYQYEIYRNPKGTGNNNNVMIARAQAGTDSYKVWQNDQSNTSQELGNKPIGNYTFEDEAILLLGAQSVAYVPVIATRPKDEARLQAGDYNTYGADIQHVGIPKMELGVIDQELSTYTWRSLDDEVCGYCEVKIPATATMPDAGKYTPHYWRSWRELANPEIAREEYQGLVRNMAGGFMYEQTTPGLNTNITSGSVSIDYGTLNSIHNEPREVNGISTGTFGVLRNTSQDIDMNFKIRMYYLVNNVTNRAPRRANGETTSPTGNYYVMEYNTPYTFDTGVITGVEGIDANREVQGVTYYNTVGIPSQQPWSGVNIVVTRYTDGSSTTAKIVR